MPPQARPLPELSIVIPVCDEQDSLPELHAELAGALDRLGVAAQIVLVDDGSTDGSLASMRELAARDARIEVVTFDRNCGKTAALAAGFDRATGEVIVTMDADLQQDPADVAPLLAKLDEGYDAVFGWRHTRRDRLLDRRLPSLAANWLIRRVTGVKVHDMGCSLAAYRRDVVVRVRPQLREGLHRFLAVLAASAGARVAEIVVSHRPRRHGRSKYGLSRTVYVVRDLLELSRSRAPTGRRRPAVARSRSR